MKYSSDSPCADSANLPQRLRRSLSLRTTTAVTAANAAPITPSKVAIKKRPSKAVLLKKRTTTLMPKRSGNSAINEDHVSFFRFDHEEFMHYPELLLPALITSTSTLEDQKENQAPVRLPFRASRPLSAATTLGAPEQPQCLAVSAFDERYSMDICVSPRSTLDPLGEPPAPPGASSRHIIDFDTIGLSDDLFLPFSLSD
jgi:hypothetical protein